MSQNEIYCRRKKCWIGTHFFPQKWTSCQRKTFFFHSKKFNVTGRIFLAQDKIWSHRKKYHITQFILQDVVFLSLVENPCCKKNFLSRCNVFPVKLKIRQKTREFLEEFRVSPQDFVGDYIPISPGISHPDTGIYFKHCCWIPKLGQFHQEIKLSPHTECAWYRCGNYYTFGN